MDLPPSARGARVDRAVTEQLRSVGREVSLREVRRALAAGQILVSGRTRAPGAMARGGESVELVGFVPRAEAELVPDSGLLTRVEVLHEDARLLALSKPSGVATQPIRADESGTLLHAAVAHAPEIAGAGPALEGGLLHRLDVGTSGVVLFAKTAEIRAELRAELSRHAVMKRYFALVECGTELPDHVRVSKAIAAAGARRVKAVDNASAGALQAFTEVTVASRFALEDGTRFAAVDADTRFGRRHQVRIHLQSLAAPIVGDPLYGRGPVAWCGRLALHAAEVRLPDGLEVRAPLPEDLHAALEHLREASAP